jgi:hypothetical protein
MPIFLMARNGLQALLRKLVPEILVSTLAAILAMAIFPSLMRSTAPLAQNGEQAVALSHQAPSSPGLPAPAETGESLARFMEHVALSHVAALKAPPAAASRAAGPEASEPANAAAVPLPPPRPLAVARRAEPGASKTPVAGGAPNEPPLSEAAAAAPQPEKAEPLLPLQYGMRLVTGLGNIISASEKGVAESVASVGNTLTSFGKNL